MNETINATVKLNVNGTEYYVAVVDGVGTYIVSNLANGTYDIGASFAGNDKYLGNVSSVKALEVNMIPTNISVVVNPSAIKVGETPVVTINMNPIINASVELKIGGKTYTVAIVNGVGSYEVSGLDSGVYDINVTYAGDDKYIESKNATKLTVNNATLVVDVVAQNVTVEQNASFVINVTDDFKGNVSITVDGKVLYNGTVKSLITADKLLAGDKIATVVFYGDDNYDKVTLDNVKFTVSRVTPDIAVVIDDVTYPAKAVAVITVGNNANGTVNVTVDGKVF
ncbi:Ig-like domain-containing protein, partial [uncultured Methanobrevibacter sp.]|uniref:Ig-like domain-containing protein n=1 Tax=uncultured Methanobrevibacter sp. TaxID=253161 RepID=UPI0025DBBD83